MSETNAVVKDDETIEFWDMLVDILGYQGTVPAADVLIRIAYSLQGNDPDGDVPREFLEPFREDVSAFFHTVTAEFEKFVIAVLGKVQDK